MSSRQPPGQKRAPPVDWPTRLREAGLRSTTLTVSVLQTLDRAGQPYSHDELAHELSADADAGKIDRVTLYRILDRLTQVGLLARMQGSDRVWRFSLTQAGAPGYFECEHCHEIKALPSDPDLRDVLARLVQRLKRSGARSAKTALTIQGTCRNCVSRGYS